MIQALIVLVIVITGTFLMLRLLPGDPLMMYIAENAMESLSPEDLQALRVEFGLDKPMHIQYIRWLSDLFRGDMGTSLYYRIPVVEMIAERLPVTIHLGVLAWILAIIIGPLAGLVCALRRGTRLDTVVTAGANFGITAPNFWFGILMIYAFALLLDWLPVCGYTSPFDDPILSTQMIIMPVVCLALFPIAATCRQTRSAMLEVIRQDYVRTAWSKGLREPVIVLRHILKNGLIPVVTLMGMHVRTIFGGSVVIETVFNVPGMGRMSVEALMGHDYPVVQGIVLISATIVLLVNLIVDITYGWLDPRIRYG